MARKKREVLPKRMALESRWQIHVAQSRVARKVNPEHLMSLALMPVSTCVHLGPGAQSQGVIGDINFECDSPVAALLANMSNSGKDLESSLASGESMFKALIWFRVG